MQTLLINYPKGFYPKTTIVFDPKPLYESELIIPDWIFQRTNGEESYVYYEEDDIDYGLTKIGKRISTVLKPQLSYSI